MTPNLSNFLNASRWVAAFLVVIGHVRYLGLVRYDDVWDKSLLTQMFYFVTSLSHQAVVVFFVISGFLIGSLTWEKWKERGSNLREYASARLSRIYVVLIPALLVGISLDIIGLHWFNASELYTNSQKYHTISLNFVLSESIDIVTFFGNVFMLQGILTSTPGSNGPLWSLAYEWWYYVIFGLLGFAFTGSGIWRVVCWIVSVVMLTLFPVDLVMWGAVWMLGIFAGKWIGSTAWRPHPAIGIAVFFVALVLARLNHSMLIGKEPLWHTFTRDILLGLAYVVALVSMSRMTKNISFPKLHAWLAGFSYTTYLFHCPAMVFIYAFGYQVFGIKFQSQPDTQGIGNVLITTLILYAYCYIFSMLTERHTKLVRSRIDVYILRIFRGNQ